MPQGRLAWILAGAAGLRGGGDRHPREIPSSRAALLVSALLALGPPLRASLGSSLSLAPLGQGSQLCPLAPGVGLALGSDLRPLHPRRSDEAVGVGLLGTGSRT